MDNFDLVFEIREGNNVSIPNKGECPVGHGFRYNRRIPLVRVSIPNKGEGPVGPQIAIGIANKSGVCFNPQ